ncbi:hypothetical protein SFRURICE_013211 [Spodoptera frugiperda]|nr:hypothetical protein SFRURICE_013211 [Spodoptera frugiperda]
MASIFCRDKQRGGTCILIKKGLSYKELPFVKTHTSVNTFEACGIELTNEKLIIICIYRTPQSDPYQFLSDFNINTFKKGKITQVFHDIARSHNIDIHINEATRKSSCIDHILSNIPNATARVLPLHLSDHETAQTLSFPLKFQTAKASIYYIYKRDNNLDNTHKFIECLQNLSWANIYMENDANKAFDCFLELICLFHNLCFPKVRVKIDLNKKTKQTWISKGLKQSSKTKRCLRYQYYKNKNQANKTKYTTYSTLLQKCINNAKRNANIKYIDRNDNKCKATWAVIKSEIHNMNPKDNIEHIKIDNTVLTKPEAYVESCLRYGLIFWGNSTDQGRVFVAQKKCIRAIYGLPSDESCQPIFKKLGLLPLPSLYVYEVSMFVKKYIQLFKTIDEVNSRSRRDQHKHKLELEIIPRIVKYNKSCPAMCVCVFNKLPCVLKTLNCTLFKNKLYNLLSQNNFYSIKQFLDYRP